MKNLLLILSFFLVFSCEKKKEGKVKNNDVIKKENSEIFYPRDLIELELKDSLNLMEQKIITDQKRHQKIQEEVKTKEILYKDILKEREEMIVRLTAEMKAAAKILEFEHAAYLRDKINKLREGK